MSRYKNGNPKRQSRFICLQCLQENKLLFPEDGGHSGRVHGHAGRAWNCSWPPSPGRLARAAMVHSSRALRSSTSRAKMSAKRCSFKNVSMTGAKARTPDGGWISFCPARSARTRAP